MTRRDEDYLFGLLEEIEDEIFQNRVILKENNMMLGQIIQAVNVYLTNHTQENESDFGRNVLANLLSNMAELRTIGNRR